MTAEDGRLLLLGLEPDAPARHRLEALCMKVMGRLRTYGVTPASIDDLEASTAQRVLGWLERMEPSDAPGWRLLVLDQARSAGVLFGDEVAEVRRIKDELERRAS